MHMNPYLSFDGRCRKAFEFYRDMLNGEIEMMMPFRGSPMATDVPENWQDKIMHASLRFGDNVLMGADMSPEHYKPMQGTWLSLHADSDDDAERLFMALAGGGHIHMAMQETFWAERFGMVIDAYGIAWMIHHEKAG